jgi:vacuolar-type H+-ATPase subunit I/STV1
MAKKKNHNWCGISLIALYGLFAIYASFVLAYLNKGKEIGKLSDSAINGIKQSFILFGFIFIGIAVALFLREYIFKSGVKEAGDTERGVAPHYFN